MVVNHSAALAIAKQNAFRAYEKAVTRKRDTLRITIALAVLFVVSAIWELWVNQTLLGPWWLILGFVGMGMRATKLSGEQVDLARANLVAVSEMCDALTSSMGTLMDRVDARLSQLDAEADEAYSYFHGTDPLPSQESRANHPSRGAPDDA